MGLRIRKSISLGGGFRINISKSGIGYSWGTKGYRITKTANGNTRKTYSIPGSGISYVEQEETKTECLSNKSKTPEESFAELDERTIMASDPVSKRIERVILLNKIAIGFLFGALLISVHVGFAVFPVVGLIMLLIAHTAARAKLSYSFDPELEAVHEKRCDAWALLSTSNKISQVVSQNDRDWKTNAGANRSFVRYDCQIVESSPYYIKTNVKIERIKLYKKSELLLLPDRVLYVRKGKVLATNYSDLIITITPTRIAEAYSCPYDAEVVDYTWQFVNKNGSPDKRYKNNRKMPVCLYAKIDLLSSSGLHLVLLASNLQKAKTFEELLHLDSSFDR